MEKRTIKTIQDLVVYQKARSAAMEIFWLTRKFPKAEIYSLTDQILRSSRSVASNIREGFAKRKYEHVFIRHLNDALGSSEESRGWLEFARDCGYLSAAAFEKHDKNYSELSSMIYSLMKNWKSF